MIILGRVTIGAISRHLGIGSRGRSALSLVIFAYVSTLASTHYHGITSCFDCIEGNIFSFLFSILSEYGNSCIQQIILFLIRFRYRFRDFVIFVIDSMFSAPVIR